MTFSDYVAEKSIAIVGPAPMPFDQSADIDGHDLVYRPAHSPIGGHRGERLDIAFLNGHAGRKIYDDEFTDVRVKLEPADWWVYKGSATMQGRRDGNWRKIVKPNLSLNLNAVTGMLFDLAQHRTGHITVFGADLYAGGPGAAYGPDYVSWSDLDVAGHAQGFIMHDPWKQMRVHRAIHATGKVVGDDRYLAAVTMTDAEYQAVIDRWKAALEEAT
jgi:hypothetical protein